MKAMISSLEPAVGFATTPHADGSGYGWTLTSLLGEFLHSLEVKFGPRDQAYAPLGIEFCGDRPRLWYPGNRRQVVIMLTDSAREDTPRAIFQLAHEAVHLLAPTGGRGAPVVEEGLATLFSHEVSAALGLGLVSSAPAYLNAAGLAARWLKDDPDGIRRTRLTEPGFALWRPATLLSANPGMQGDLAHALCQPFEAPPAKRGSHKTRGAQQ